MWYRDAAKKGANLQDLSYRIFILVEKMRDEIDEASNMLYEKYSDTSTSIREQIPTVEEFTKKIYRRHPLWNYNYVVTAARDLYYRKYQDAINAIQEAVDKVWLEFEEKKDAFEAPLLRQYEGLINKVINDSGIFINPIVVHFKFHSDETFAIGRYERASQEGEVGFYLPGGSVTFYELSDITPQLIEHELTHAIDYDYYKGEKKHIGRSYTTSKDWQFIYYNSTSELRARAKEIILTLRSIYGDKINDSDFRKGLVKFIQETQAWDKMAHWLSPQSQNLVYSLVYNNLYN